MLCCHFDLVFIVVCEYMYRMGSALLSRFDLVFILLDKPNEVSYLNSDVISKIFNMFHMEFVRIVTFKVKVKLGYMRQIAAFE